MQTADVAHESAMIENDAPVARELRRWTLQLGPVYIARYHLALAGAWLALGLVFAWLLRLELMTPALDLMQARTFGTLLSLHGFLLVYFVALPAFPGIIGHLVLARWTPGGTLAYPKLARVSWQLLAAGGALVASFFLLGGTPIGWSFDSELNGRFGQPGTALMASGVLLSAVALFLMGVNTLASLRVIRRTGLPTGGSRVLAESLRCGSIIGVIVAPLLAVAMVLVLGDAVLGRSVFDAKAGGDPQQFVRLFRLFFVPAQGMLLIFGLGVALSVVADRCRAAVFTRWHLYTFVLLVALSFGAWGGSASASVLAGNPLAPVMLAALVFSLVFIVRFLRTGLTRVDTALIYAFGFFFTAVQGLGAGLLAALPLNGLATTQWASAQMHLVMMAVLGMALPAGLHAVWPALTGRSYSEAFGRPFALLVVVGTQLAFVPLLILGLQGVPFRANSYLPEFQVWHVLATAGAGLLVVGMLLSGLNLLIGQRAKAQA